MRSIVQSILPCLSRYVLSHTILYNSHGSWHFSTTLSSSSSMNVSQLTHYESIPISFTPSTSISFDAKSKTLFSTIV